MTTGTQPCTSFSQRSPSSAWSARRPPPPLAQSDFSAGATTITFDDLSGGSTITTGDIITTQYAAQGITFVNPDDVTRANASLGGAAITSSKPNVAFVGQRLSHPSGERPEQLVFSVPVTQIGLEFFTSNGATITLSVFDVSNMLLESETLTGTNFGSSAGLLEGFIGLGETTDIAYAEISSRSGGLPFNFEIDNVMFEGPADSIPEPAGWSLLTLSLAGLGVIRRLRAAAAERGFRPAS
jgi:hypothetical protein